MQATAVMNEANVEPVTTSNGALWTGRVMSAIPVLFLLFDGLGKLMRVAPVIEGTQQLGYPVGVIVPLGIVLLLCTMLYAIPATSVLGAILLTGYLGGAIATHVRVENPLPTHTLFPIYVALLVWGGLWLRDPALRRLIPLRR